VLWLTCGLSQAGIAFISAETIGYLPVSGGFIRFIPRYSDQALGVAVGYTFWYLLAITAAAEVVAASSLVACKQHWNRRHSHRTN
jgi:yeast amino acid transporter